MEEIREAAIAYYENGSQKQKQLARDIFNCLDADGDGTVDVQEFIDELSSRGHKFEEYFSFFKELDRDGNGSMGFAEVLSFLYIVETRRPFCGGCRILLKGLFFTCVKCRGSCNYRTFDLCSACFGAKRFSHFHDAFSDNYTFLAQNRLITVGGDQGHPNRRQETSSSVNYRQGMPAHAIVARTVGLVGTGAKLGSGIAQYVSYANNANPSGIAQLARHANKASLCSIM